ncbi:MAG: CRISPR-associated protein Cas4 [Candidatus Micrarchaeia archaeon]
MRGIFISSFVMCRTELWYQSHNINLDKFDTNILKGRIVAEESLQNLTKEIAIGDIKIDRINFRRKIITEIKKSKKSLDEGKYQLIYYLYKLKHLTGIEFKGEISIPKENYKETIILGGPLELDLKKILKEVKYIINLEMPPAPENKPYCKGCMYYELCWS